MRVLIACESSGSTRRAFRATGHDAVSCDLLPPDDNSPHHYQGDVRDLLSQQCAGISNAMAAQWGNA